VGGDRLTTVSEAARGGPYLTTRRSRGSFVRYRAPFSQRSNVRSEHTAQGLTLIRQKRQRDLDRRRILDQAPKQSRSCACETLEDMRSSRTRDESGRKTSSPTDGNRTKKSTSAPRSRTIHRHPPGRLRRCLEAMRPGSIRSSGCQLIASRACGMTNSIAKGPRITGRAFVQLQQR